jgi:hypothetical protein
MYQLNYGIGPETLSTTERTFPKPLTLDLSILCYVAVHNQCRTEIKNVDGQSVILELLRMRGFLAFLRKKGLAHQSRDLMPQKQRFLNSSVRVSDVDILTFLGLPRSQKEVKSWMLTNSGLSRDRRRFDQQDPQASNC